MTERSNSRSNVSDARLPGLALDALVAAVAALPERKPVRPTLRVVRNDEASDG